MSISSNRRVNTNLDTDELVVDDIDDLIHDMKSIKSLTLDNDTSLFGYSNPFNEPQDFDGNDIYDGTLNKTFSAVPEIIGNTSKTVILRGVKTTSSNNLTLLDIGTANPFSRILLRLDGQTGKMRMSLDTYDIETSTVINTGEEYDYMVSYSKDKQILQFSVLNLNGDEVDNVVRENITLSTSSSDIHLSLIHI